MVGNYIVSFMGFLPADNPEVIVYIAVDNAKGITLIALVVTIIVLLILVGVSLNLDSCVNCNSTKNIVTLSSIKGGFLCQNCNNEEYSNPKTIKMVRMYYYVKISSITKIDTSIFF